MADRSTKIPGNQIQDKSIKQIELDITNTPTDGQILKINMPSGDFTAIDSAEGHVQNTDTKLDEGGANEIDVTEIPKALKEYVEYYVSGTGSDETGDGSSDSPFRSITHAFSLTSRFSNADDAFVQINVRAGTYNENVLISAYQCPVYINGSDSTLSIINGGVRIKDCVHVEFGFLQVNIANANSAFYTERSRISVYNTKVGGGVNASAFEAERGSTIIYTNISDSAVPCLYKFTSRTGSFILKDVSEFALNEYSHLDGFVSEGINLVKTEYEDLLFKKHTQNTDTILDEDGTNEVSAEEIRNFIDNPTGGSADVISTTESGKTVQDKIDEFDSHIADKNNPHEITVTQVVNTLFGQDIEGDLRPQEDYWGQGGFFEIDVNYNREPKESLEGITDFFFELDENNDIIPKA